MYVCVLQFVLLMSCIVFGAKMACLGYYRDIREHRDHAEDEFLRIFDLGFCFFAFSPLTLCGQVSFRSVHIHTYIHTYTHPHKHTHTHARTRTHKHIHKHTHTNVFIHVCARARVCMYVCLGVCACICVYVYFF